MPLLYLKLCSTPLLMLLISLAARRWGGLLGGLLSGLPITSAVVMLFLTLEQGQAFALQAVPGALAGLAAVLVGYLVYLRGTRRLPVAAGGLLALLCYGLAALLFSRLGSLAGPVLAALALIALLVYLSGLETAPLLARGGGMPVWMLPVRMLAATLLLLAVTASAHWLGPQLSGVLAPIPVIAWPLTVFSHVQGGRGELAAVVRGNAIGAVGVLGFYLVLSAALAPLGVAAAFASAIVAALVLTLLLARVLHKTPR